MKKYTIAIEVSTDALRAFADDYLVSLWHAAQANPAPLEDPDACHLVEHIGREIIRRFICERDPTLWARQGTHAYFYRALALASADETCASEGGAQ